MRACVGGKHPPRLLDILPLTRDSLTFLSLAHTHWLFRAVVGVARLLFDTERYGMHGIHS